MLDDNVPVSINAPTKSFLAMPGAKIAQCLILSSCWRSDQNGSIPEGMQ